MSVRFNARRVFYGAPSKKDFLTAITAAESVEDRLRAARDDIREAVRQAFAAWISFITREEFVKGSVSIPALLRPKFRMQGSYAYRTLNAPAQTPPQEVDLDDGMFLPVSFVSGNGHNDPAIASHGLFQLVERALEPLCRRRNWELDRSRPSCVRIRVSTSAHIDLTLYSIPDTEFIQLSESLLAKRAYAADSAALPAIEFDEELYHALASEQIMLAHRTKGWKPSDPRKLEEWFLGAIQLYGSILRRLCRYIKAWRDHQWRACSLSSIALMACVVNTFRSVGKAIDASRDDAAFELISRDLHRQLQGPIENPVVAGQYLDDDWSDAERTEFLNRARALADGISSALRCSDTPADLLRRLTDLLGHRVPDDVSLVEVEEQPRGAVAPQAPAVLMTGLLRQPVLGASPPPVQKSGERRYA